MGSLVGQGLVWMALVHAGHTGMVAIGRLVRIAEDARDEWRAERDFRACLGVVQLRWNVESATAHLASTRAEDAARLLDAGGRLAARLDAYLPGGDDDCDDVGARLGLAFDRHLERHPGQPDPWPNWTARWRQAPAP